MIIYDHDILGTSWLLCHRLQAPQSLVPLLQIPTSERSHGSWQSPHPAPLLLDWFQGKSTGKHGLFNGGVAYRFSLEPSQ